ncbi:MAG: MCE family protein [bacterium]|nr:MCE family protein [bacterium]
MKKAKYEIGVGIVFFIALGILSYYTVLMSRKFLDPGETYTIKVAFRDVSGLGVTNKVKVNGVASGSVEKISLAENVVHVSLRMFNRFTMYENYKISITTEAALGGKHVSIYPGEPVDLEGKEFAVLTTRENLSGKLEDPFTTINDLINENRGNIFATIKNVRQITEKINSGRGTLAKLLNDESVHMETDILLKQTNTVLKQTDGLLRDLNEAVEDAREQAPVTSFIRAALTAF